VLHPLHSFCFAELRTPDLASAQRHYGDLLGWSSVDVPGTSGNYCLFQIGSRTVVGLRRADAETRWVAYVHVENVDATTARARELGADVVSPPGDTPGLARTSVLADREGAVIGLWEPHGLDGTAVETGPGSLWWVELLARDIDAAGVFYSSLFGWDVTYTSKFDTPHVYTLFKIGDRSVSGGGQLDPEWGVTPRWQVYFEVANHDATASRACELGGTSGFWRDVPHAGRIGHLTDARGGEFVVAQPLTANTPSR
jgi:predicted enzyme related to lactoylglutathione lyase